MFSIFPVSAHLIISGYGFFKVLKPKMLRYPGKRIGLKSPALLLCLSKMCIRDRNMDAAVNSFLKENPSGIIVNLGCGLETTFYRNDNGTATWYELDLPEVIELREKYLGKHERDISIPASVFDEEWGGIVKESANRKNVLFLASGLLYYFEDVYKRQGSSSQSIPD